LRDDPADPSLAGAGSFDREGQPCEGYDLIRDGVVAGWLYDSYAAAVEGRPSTGHALGGTRNQPVIGPHSLVVDPGDGGDFDALAAQLGRGLYLGRFSGTVDPASGDFSGVAKSARWIEGGRVERPLRETLLSGNVFALARRILALGSRSERLDGAALAPLALVDGISVVAG
jgi:PmbA protein